MRGCLPVGRSNQESVLFGTGTEVFQWISVAAFGKPGGEGKFGQFGKGRGVECSSVGHGGKGRGAERNPDRGQHVRGRRFCRFCDSVTPSVEGEEEPYCIECIAFLLSC